MVENLTKGDIERYSDGAAVASLGAVGVSLGLSRDPRRAADLALAGVPKAATLGREVFASTVTMVLSSHGVVVMDPAALRRLDRVSVLAVDARLLSSGRWGIDAVHPIGEGRSASDCELRCRRLLDVEDPTVEQRRGSWTLAPWRGDARAPRGTDAQARRMRLIMRTNRRTVNRQPQPYLPCAATAKDAALAGNPPHGWLKILLIC